MGARIFYVDGTNLVRTAYGYGGPQHETQEQADSERLVEIFDRLCEDLGGSVEVELFFDGVFRAMPESRSANFRVTFTDRSSADDMILGSVRARKWNGAGTATVVTGDRGLGSSIEAEGGKWMRVSYGTPPENVARRIGGRFSK